MDLPIHHRTTSTLRIIWRDRTTAHSGALHISSDCSIFQHYRTTCQKCVCFRFYAHSINLSDCDNLNAPYDYDLFRLKTFTTLCLLLVLLWIWSNRLHQFLFVLQNVQTLLGQSVAQPCKTWAGLFNYVSLYRKPPPCRRCLQGGGFLFFICVHAIHSSLQVLRSGPLQSGYQ